MLAGRLRVRELYHTPLARLAVCAGPTVFIFDECVGLCMDIVQKGAPSIE
jgi:hypothetical protein